MKLDQFLKKRKLVLSAATENVCKEGIERMCISKDPHHSDRHVYGLLDELDTFLDNEVCKIDFSVLLPAICWHDVWKSTRRQSANIPLFIFEQLYDGHGSAKLFKKYVKEAVSLSRQQTEHITYCITKHAQFSHWIKVEHIFLPKTVEAKIIRDIDELDRWSLTCFNHLKQAYLGEGKQLNPKLIPVAKWWFFNIIKKAEDTKFYFNYSKNEFLQRKQIFIKEIYRIWDDRYKYVDNTEANKKYLEDSRMQGYG